MQSDQLADQHAEIVIERPVGGDAAQRRLPEMDVAVYEAGHGDHAAAVDLDHGPAAEVSADGYDLAVVDEQIAGIDEMPTFGSIETMVAPLILMRRNMACS